VDAQLDAMQIMRAWPGVYYKAEVFGLWVTSTKLVDDRRLHAVCKAGIVIARILHVRL